MNSFINKPYYHFHIKRPSEPIWIDKEKRKYNCECELSNSHIKNIINMLSNIVLPFPMFNGDEAQYQAENEYVSDSERIGDMIHYWSKLLENRESQGYDAPDKY